MKKKILIVEDEFRMREIIRDYLENENFEVYEAESGETALECLNAQSFELVILDVMLPGIDGLSICQYLRKRSAVPIILLTARSEEDDRLLGFELGADDYITKPFSPRELLARVKSLLKRSEISNPPPAHLLSVEGITMNKFDRTVLLNQKQVDFTAKEFDLLLYFIENEGIILSREQLLKSVWNHEHHELGLDFRTVDTHVKRLRSKLDSKSYYITTHVKSGYLFKVEL